MKSQNLISKLDNWLKENRPAYYNKLAPGATAEALDEFEKAIGLKLSEGLKLLYMWKNGQEGEETLQYNWMFMSLRQIQEATELLNDLLKSGDFELENWWCTKWLPFLDNGGGDYLCLDTEGAFKGVKGQIITFWHDWEDRSIEYPSYEKWFESFVLSLEANLWKNTTEGVTPLDEDELESFIKKINAGYPVEKSAQ
jgi:cell wall assembly regulator SMI1